jgi:hypothetical protein
MRNRVAGASLRTRVMAVAAFLVVLTSLVTGILGTTLLRSYLLGRSDSQLRNFAKVATRVLSRTDINRDQTLPTQFLVEIIGADGKALTPSGSEDPRLSAGQLNDVGTPFTVQTASYSWRVIVEPLSGGRHAVIAYSLDDLHSTVTRLEVADAIAGAIALALLAGIGVPLVRASLVPLKRIEVRPKSAG